MDWFYKYTGCNLVICIRRGVKVLFRLHSGGDLGIFPNWNHEKENLRNCVILTIDILITHFLSYYLFNERREESLTFLLKLKSVKENLRRRHSNHYMFESHFLSYCVILIITNWEAQACRNHSGNFRYLHFLDVKCSDIIH